MRFKDYEKSIFCITGGTGSFGSTMVKHLLSKNVKEIRVFSRDESKQDDMRNELADSRVRFYIGDVRDKRSVSSAIKGSDFVFHAAALKQVPSCEFFPGEAIQTNIYGSDNVVNASIELGVKKLVCLSTDKAVYPINAMGMSKALMEKVILANVRNNPDSETGIAITRYGNVMMSRGSVIPRFVKQAISKQPLTVTNPKMTRFIMSLSESVDLVERAFFNSNSGDLLVRKSPACTVENLAQAIWRIVNPTMPVQVSIIGTRHGEKGFETLLSQEEQMRCQEEEQYFRVPIDTRALDYSAYFDQGLEKPFNDAYSSDSTQQLTVEQIIEILLNLPEFERYK